MKKITRNYRMKKRAEQVRQNEQNIMEATFSLWKKYAMHEITLEKVSEMSNVSVRTLLRKYGSKEGLIEYCIDYESANISQNRSKAVKGDVEGALNILIDSYEEIGEAAFRTLAIEDDLAVAKKAMNIGRAQHKEWCEQVFEPYLPDKQANDYAARLHAFFSATDYYLWKLNRKDLRKSKEETYTILMLLVKGLIKKSS